MKHVVQMTADELAALVEEAVRKAMKSAPARPLNAKEASDYLGISRPTLSRWITDGRIPRRQATRGGHLFFFRDDLDRAARGSLAENRR